jgi:hypothetical protein
MAFWSDSRVEPKRQFRWLFIIPGGNGQPAVETYLIKGVNKPTTTLASTPVQYLQHTFKYPGRLTWNDVTVSLIDAIDPDTSSTLARLIQSSGYKIPTTEQNAQFSFSKANAVASLNNPRIQQLDGGNTITGEPPKIIDEWTLINAWAKSVDFGGSLTYTSDDLVQLSLTISYDWAEYSSRNLNSGQLERVLSGQSG